MEGMKLVYCQKCGTKNLEDVKVCKKCGVRLYPLDKAVEREVRTCFGPEKREQNECFGLPHGGVIAAVIIGAIIIIAGLSSLVSNVFHWDIEVWNSVWPMLVIVIGILIIAGAVYGMSRRK